MKLFSRKALLAGATSVALLTGAGAATAQASEVVSVQAQTKTATTTTNSSSEKSTKETADEIKSWIGIITAVIGALTTVFTFAQRFFLNK